ncbi:phosphopantetheine adenylyltransferase [Halonotius terrestris]|uniref:Phosphopantetheine adenylyltransferase n=1 Tax=Halonotius terrestris TaxID=2487750 RepID=A0A8J8PB43_9EURY|nr:phosphopantetheine adenylyltransferase [Halonotius terrestris]TQQ79826.1 phosphopantetheine adenylyltransferase [Halonotius terrestris]
MNVALGGTFDPVHDGHRALFERAFSLGDVTVGLTSDSLAPKTRDVDRPIRSFEERKADLTAELEALATEHDQEFEIRTLTKPTGIAVEPQFDALVVSPETVAGAERINEIRAENGHEELRIEVVDHVDADDGERISSTRILKGEIDRHGNLTPEAAGRQSD